LGADLQEFPLMLNFYKAKKRIKFRLR